MKNQQQILRELIRVLANGNQSKFAEQIGIPSKSLNKYVSGEVEMRFSIMQKIKLSYPFLRDEFLISGEGAVYSIDSNLRELGSDEISEVLDKTKQKH